MIYPKKLNKGDTIGIIAPSSPYRALCKESLNYELDNIKKTIENFGYKVKMGSTCYLSYKGYLAGTDEDRVKDIEIMFEDKTIDAILCLKGGYGTPRILNKINYDIIKNNPKIFIGYSDITALHIAFNQICNLVTFHGIMAATVSNWDEFTYNSFMDILDMKENLELKSKIYMLNEQIRSFGSMENSLQKTLVVAQNTADEIVRTARDKEESIIAQAERRANTITENATNQIIESQNEYEVLRKEILMFRNKYKSLLNAQLDTIDHYCDDNVFSVLDDMKEKDFEFSNQTKPQVAQEQDQHQEQAASVEPQKSEYEQAYAQVQTDVQAEPEVEFKSEDFNEDNMTSESLEPTYEQQFKPKEAEV